MAASILKFSRFWGNKSEWEAKQGQLTCSLKSMYLGTSPLMFLTLNQDKVVEEGFGLPLWGHGGTLAITRCCSILSLAGKLQAGDLGLLPIAACGWAGHLLHLSLDSLPANLLCSGTEREGGRNYNLMEFYVLWWEELTVGSQHGPLHQMTGKVVF